MPTAPNPEASSEMRGRGGGGGGGGHPRGGCFFFIRGRVAVPPPPPQPTPLRHAVLVSTLAVLMAQLVAQSRVEAGIHSVVETLAGAVLGTCVAIVIFQLWG